MGRETTSPSYRDEWDQIFTSTPVRGAEGIEEKTAQMLKSYVEKSRSFKRDRLHPIAIA